MATRHLCGEAAAIRTQPVLTDIPVRIRADMHARGGLMAVLVCRGTLACVANDGKTRERETEVGARAEAANNVRKFVSN